MFESQFQNISTPLDAIIQPVKDALSTTEASVEQAYADLQTQLTATQAALATAQAQDVADEATIASLQQQIKTLQAAGTTFSSPSGFADLHMHSDWALHTADPTIGPWAVGSTFTLQQMQTLGDARYAMKLSVQGVAGSYSDGLASVSRRPVPPAGEFHWGGRVFVDANTAAGAQALENDTILSKGGMRYNFSSQINVNKGGMLQVAGSGGWKDTGIIVPLASQAGVWHTFLWEYIWDDKTPSYSPIAYSFDGTRFPIPDTFNGIQLTKQVPTATNWTDSVHPQLQLDTNSKGIGYSVSYDKLRYTFPN